MFRYRPEIDGLRALSILPVVAYHAGLSAVPGGFVGVDVFFVISGYLIGSIILGEIEKGRFSILRFYERRVRRILPALLAMLAAVSMAATLFLLPNEFAPFPPSLIATLLFGSNILFWRRAGYFAPAAEQESLLHTWSIGIEEQFYLFVPLLLIALYRFRLRWWLIGLTLGSLALCILLTPSRPGTVFFLLPTRAWELSVGLLLATLPPRVPVRVDGAVAAVGIGAILAAALTFSDATAFPGYSALLPVIGASLVIRYSAGTWAGRALSWLPVVFVGLISYSLYLWHWPLIVFGRLLGYDLPLTAMLAFPIAVVSWRFIEQPFRQKGRIGRGSLFAATGGMTTVLLVFGLISLRSDGWPQRWSDSSLAMDAAHNDHSRYRSCHRGDNTIPIARSCVLGGRTADIAVWADSHGLELAEALSERHPLMSITYSSCPPSLGFVAERPGCVEHNERVIRYLETSSIRTIVIAAHWGRWNDERGYWPGLIEAVRRLRIAGKRVIVIGPEPHPGYDVPSRLARGGAVTFPRAEYEQRLASEISNLQRLQWIAEVFWPDRYLCSGARCLLVVDAAPTFYDDNHLSIAGARYLVPRLLP